MGLGWHLWPIKMRSLGSVEFELRDTCPIETHTQRDAVASTH